MNRYMHAQAAEAAGRGIELVKVLHGVKRDEKGKRHRDAERLRAGRGGGIKGGTAGGDQSDLFGAGAGRVNTGLYGLSAAERERGEHGLSEHERAAHIDEVNATQLAKVRRRLVRHRYKVVFSIFCPYLALLSGCFQCVSG